MSLLCMSRTPLVEEALTRSVIGAFYDVYNTLGFGFLEQVYTRALERELLARGHAVECQVGVQVMYKGEPLAQQRLDMLVDGKLVIEIKSSLLLHPAADRQLYNYLKATNLEVGLLFHFGPEPVFHRLLCRNARINPMHSSLPMHPIPPP
jgi:GxxExxY protein